MRAQRAFSVDFVLEDADAQEYLCQPWIVVQASLQQVPQEIERLGAKSLEFACADPVDSDVCGVVDGEETNVSAVPWGYSVSGRSRHVARGLRGFVDRLSPIGVGSQCSYMRSGVYRQERA